jgi:hypothetical protein
MRGSVEGESANIGARSRRINAGHGTQSFRIDPMPGAAGTRFDGDGWRFRPIAIAGPAV